MTSWSFNVVTISCFKPYTKAETNIQEFIQLDQNILKHQSLKEDIIANVRQQVDVNATDQRNVINHDKV
jgi:hypothetical protein